jgi:hypothetical protein
MSDHITTERPPATLDQLRDALFDTAVMEPATSADPSPNRATLELMATEIRAGRLIDAGRIPPPTLFDPIRANAQAAVRTGRLHVPHPIMPVIFSVAGAASSMNPAS